MRSCHGILQKVGFAWCLGSDTRKLFSNGVVDGRPVQRDDRRLKFIQDQEIEAIRRLMAASSLSSRRSGLRNKVGRPGPGRTPIPAIRGILSSNELGR